MPLPPYFSGLPDFSYSLLDWINKNAFCPLDEEVEGCHDFKGWMGALNANHFGSQAKDTYWHLHGLALNLAEQARALREKLAQNESVLKAYREYIREAEWEALAVEGYAQHFLQDRWAMGHMWERWSTADYGKLPTRHLVDNLALGAFAGLLHGSESISTQPDALSSPTLITTRTRAVSMNDLDAASTPGGAGKAAVDVSRRMVAPSVERYYIPKWKHQSDGDDGRTHNGIGDHRFVDMFDQGFGKEYLTTGKDVPLTADRQRSEMGQCLMAGWAEVIRRLGAFGGGYGIQRLRVREDVRGFDALPFRCDDMWATNRAVYEGWNDTLRGLLSRIFIGVDSARDNPAATATTLAGVSVLGRRLGGRKIAELGHQAILYSADMSTVDRMMLLRMDQAIFRAAMLDPDGTSLARGRKLPPLGQFAPGNFYPGLASYVDPQNLETLKDTHPKSLDKKAWFGFFNRSHAAYWCEQGAGLFQELRGSDNAMDRSACYYLADRFYEGTDPAYRGSQSEHRGASAGAEAVPAVCSVLKGKPDTYSENLPVFLHPGYVSIPYDDSVLADGEPRRRSLQAWCDKVPVIDLSEEQALRDANVVAEISVMDSGLRLSGHNFGEPGGQVLIAEDQGGGRPLGSVQAWSDEAIQLAIADGELKAGKEYELRVTTSDGRKSVGLFRLRVNDGPPTKTKKVVGEDRTVKKLYGKDAGRKTVSVETGTGGCNNRYQATLWLDEGVFKDGVLRIPLNWRQSLAIEGGGLLGALCGVSSSMELSNISPVNPRIKIPGMGEFQAEVGVLQNATETSSDLKRQKGMAVFELQVGLPARDDQPIPLDALGDASLVFDVEFDGTSKAQELPIRVAAEIVVRRALSAKEDSIP